MPKQFESNVLQLIRDIEEIHIETYSSTGKTHQVIIWVVVIDNNVYVRSVRGPGARWYKELTATSQGAIVADGQHFPVHSVPVTDEADITRVSNEFLRKYHDSPYVGSMVRQEILTTTLWLEPA